MGRRTKASFYSQTRSGYLGLNTNQVYSYDPSKHRLTQVQRESDAYQKAQYAYDDTDGRVTRVTYGTGARAEYGYDASGALTQVRHYANGGTLIGSVAYEYGNAGNVTRAVLDDGLTYNGDVVVTYQYDDLYRLTREYCDPDAGSYRQEYECKYWFDAVGNRTKLIYNKVGVGSKETRYSYSPRNELTKQYIVEDDETWVWQYDLRGNLTKKYDGSGAYVSYGWDSRNKLTKVYDSSQSKTVEYMYDFAGRRVAKKVGAGVWRWYFYEGLNVVAEGVGSGNKVYYTNASGGPGGLVCRDNNGAQFYRRKKPGA